MPLHASAVGLLMSNLTDTPDPAVRGRNIVYAVSVANNTTDIANNVAVMLSLRAHTTFVAASELRRYRSDGHPALEFVACTSGRSNRSAIFLADLLYDDGLEPQFLATVKDGNFRAQKAFYGNRLGRNVKVGAMG